MQSNAINNGTEPLINPAKYAEETLSVNLEGNTTTDLSDLNVDDRKDSRAIYDIMGRKLSAPVKGINIIDGKKYMY